MISKWLVTGALAFLVLTRGGAAQSVPELLEKGIYTQETVGDLDHAIEIYRQIVSSELADRTYAAQAQYRLAQCLLQKGAKLDAAREFKKLIKGYPKEQELVERARTALLPLARQLEADYEDPALGISFSSPEWPIAKAFRNDDGSIEVQLGALYDGHKHPHRVDFPVVRARRSKAASVGAFYEENIKEQCPMGCRVLSTREWKGWQVLKFVSNQFPNSYNDRAPSVSFGVMIETGKTEVAIQATAPIEDLERGQSIIEKILESMHAS